MQPICAGDRRVHQRSGQEVTKRDTEIVSQVLGQLRLRIGLERCGVWFERSATLSARPGTILVQCRSPFVCELVQRQFREDIQAAVREVLPDAVVRFVVDDSPELPNSEDGAPTRGAHGTERADAASAAAVGRVIRTKTAPSEKSPRERTAEAISDGRLPASKRQFESFATYAVGPSNRLAVTMATMVCERPGHASPLLLHGSTAVGKTHLLQAIWTQIKTRAPRSIVRYLTAEQFTSDFVDALFRKETANLRQKYRGVDVLLLDDLHFLIGKVKTAGELLQTIEMLIQHGKQIVLSASVPPRELAALGPELHSRIQGGMIAEIEPPNHATRIEIARHHAQRLDLATPPEVLWQVAAQIGVDARAMRGALRRLSLTSQAEGGPLDLELAERTLAQIARENSRPVRLGDVERAICDVFGVQPGSLRSARKSQTVSGARTLAMFLARKYTRAALVEIGQHFGRRSHSSVIAASKKIQRWMQEGEAIVVADQNCRIDEAIRRVEEALRRA